MRRLINGFPGEIRIVRGGYVPLLFRLGRMLPFYAGQTGEAGNQYFHETQWSLVKVGGRLSQPQVVIAGLSKLPSGLQKAVLFVSEAFGSRSDVTEGFDRIRWIRLSR